MRYVLVACLVVPIYAQATRTQLTPVGTALPTATSCDDSSEVGLVYVRSDNPATSNAQVYVCRQTGASSYGWHPISHFVGTTAPATCAVGQLFFDSDATAGSNWFGCTAASTWTLLSGGGGGGSGDVTGPASSTNGNLPSFSGTTGKVLQDSGIAAASVSGHIASTSNPHSVTKAQVGLGNVPNTDATARANHTGTQLASTISDFNAAVGLTNAGTATALAANPAPCTAGQFVSDIAANGTLTCGTPAGGGSGDVTAAAAFANDNRLIRSDGTAKGVQASGVTLDDSGNMTIPGNLTVTGTVDIGSGTPWNLTGITDDVAPGAPGSANQFVAYVDRTSGVLKIHRNGQGSSETYMTTATAVADSQINVKYRTYTCTFNVAEPVAADSGKYKCQIPVAATITYIACHTDTGSVATVNINKRASATPGTSGTNAMSSSLTCSSTPSTGTITSASVTARDWLTLTNGSPASSPTVLTVSVEYTVN